MNASDLERQLFNATRELAHVRSQVVDARADLGRLQQDMVEAQGRLNGVPPSQLLEANEQLVIAALRTQTDAETTARKLRDMSRQAELDVLTELPNRVLLLNRFARAAAHARRHCYQLGLLFIDLNDFKHINDTLGHAVGDRVLKLVARRLASSVRDVDTVSRYGGDEFMILLTEVSRADMTLVAGKLLTELGIPCRVGEHVLCLTASIGISVYPDDGEDADTLIDRADAAMYRAKRHGLRSFAFHDCDPVGEQSPELPLLESDKHALDDDTLVHAEHEHRYGQLREANERLVLAALTAQELQAAAEDAQRRQTEFLAVIAHELRSPLSPIRTAAEMLGHLRSDEPLLARVQAIIERQVAHMSRLVGDLLDVSRVNTGKLRLEHGLVDIKVVIAAAADACGPAIETRRQHFDVQMPSCALDIDGDSVRLTQVFTNLLDNASKYTPNGGRIELSVSVVDDAIVATVSDNGIGITAEALPKVFEPFVQDTQAIGFNGVGLGIGLTVVRELVEAHSGKVVASSVGSGCGSQFIVMLPKAASAITDQK
ncbi:diguanylate cyclase [Caballeronia sp. dw_19]|uniref:diguanylate cyclase domain-containing protein n=1 Tax=Caballeronia sp. dw_19 TaxID=2719791 RepID=UPI001BD5AB19|nr:diguanylate cyclase [Caballeronia sp. dw_19]